MSLSISRIGLVCVGAVALFFGVNYLQKLRNNYYVPPVNLITAPYLHHEGQETPSKVYHPGEAFMFRLVSERHVECTVLRALSLVEIHSVDNKTSLIRYWFNFPLTRAPSFIGKIAIDERRVIPPWITPGDYFLLDLSQYECKGVVITETSHPPLPLTVTGPVMNDKGQ